MLATLNGLQKTLRCETMAFQSPKEAKRASYSSTYSRQVQIRVVDCGKTGKEMVNCGWEGPFLDLTRGSLTYS